MKKIFLATLFLFIGLVGAGIAAHRSNLGLSLSLSMGSGTGGPSGPAFLREDGGYILREDGSYLLREN